MTLSVVIPTYNSAPFLRETLASVLTQTTPPDEIIIADDCSTDTTPEIAQEMSRLESRIPIRFVQTSTPSGGPAVPLNLGIGQSRGDYLALLDHDDLMQPGKLELQLASLRQSAEALLSFGDYRTFGGPATGGMSTAMRDEIIARSVACGHYYLVPAEVMLQLQVIEPGIVQSCSNLVFHRSLWHQAGPFDAKISAICDYAFKLRAAPLSFATFVPEPLFLKRIHANNLYTQAADPILMWKMHLLRMEAVRRFPQFTVKSRHFRLWYKNLLVGLLQSRWWHDDYRAVWGLWLQGVDMLGAEFLADTFRWLAGKTSVRLLSALSSLRRGSKS